MWVEFYQKKKISPILGDDQFKASVLSGKTKAVDVPELAAERLLPTLDQIIDAVCQYYSVSKMMIWKQTRGKGVKIPAGSVAIYLCQQAADMRLAEIAGVFGLSSYTSAGATIRHVKVRKAVDKQLNRDINYILFDLTP